MATTATARAADDEDEWISITEAAALVGIAQGTLYRKIRAGLLQPYRRPADNKTVLKRADLTTFMQPKPIRKSAKGKR